MGLSFQGGYEKSLIGQADVLGFGPIVELARRKLLITMLAVIAGFAMNFSLSHLVIFRAR
jgi:hypothetical protein